MSAFLLPHHCLTRKIPFSLWKKAIKMFEETASAMPSIWASMNSWFTPTVLFVLLNLTIGTIALTSALANQKQHHRQQPTVQSQTHDLPPPKLDRSPSVLQRLKSINFYSYYRSQEPQNFTTQLKNPTDLETSQEPQNFTTQLKKTTDSETPYNLEQTHQPRNLETQSQYFFPQPRQENFQENPEQRKYIYQQTHKEIPRENQTHQEQSEENELQSMDEVYSKLTGSHFSRTKSDTEPASGEIPTRLPVKMRKSASVKSAFGHFEEEDIVEAKRPATVRERGSAKDEADEGVDAMADDFINRFKQQLKLQRLDSIIRYKEMIGKRTGI